MSAAPGWRSRRWWAAGQLLAGRLANDRALEVWVPQSLRRPVVWGAQMTDAVRAAIAGRLRFDPSVGAATVGRVAGRRGRAAWRERLRDIPGDFGGLLVFLVVGAALTVAVAVIFAVLQFLLGRWLAWFFAVVAVMYTLRVALVLRRTACRPWFGRGRQRPAGRRQLLRNVATANGPTPPAPGQLRQHTEPLLAPILQDCDRTGTTLYLHTYSTPAVRAFERVCFVRAKPVQRRWGRQRFLMARSPHPPTLRCPPQSCLRPPTFR